MVGLAAVVVSIAALGVSTLLTTKQVALAQRNVNLVGFLELMEEFRRSEFHTRYNYVTTRLRLDCVPTATLGIFDLPEPAYSTVIDIAYFFQNCASYAGYGLLDEEMVMAFVHLRLVAVWTAVEPYVIAERNNNPMTGRHFLGLLESYATKARSISSDEAMKNLPTVD